MSVQFPLSGVKQTSRRKAATSGFDPERTWHSVPNFSGKAKATKVHALEMQPSLGVGELNRKAYSTFRSPWRMPVIRRPP